MKLTVVVTVYNEKPTILKAIEQAKNIKADKQIIVVDNCSTDGTRDILKNLNDSSLEIVYQPENYGYGRSVITGMNLAKGEYIFVHNSDLEYDPNCVYEMLRLSEQEKLDAIFGSRLINRRGESKIKIIRERPFYLGTVILTFLTNIFYGKNFTDIIGNRFYRTSVLKKINPRISGIGFDFEVVSKLCKYGYKIKELPVIYQPRTKGKKVKAIDIVPAVWTMLKIKLFSRRDKKVLAITNKASVKSILVFRTDRFGEFLLNIPAIRSLKINYPASRLVLAVNPYVHELAESIDKVDEVIDWENRKHSFIELLRFSKRIREKRFSICVILNPSKELNIVSFLAGIPLRLGYNRKWGFLLTRKIEDIKYLGYSHEVEYNLELVRSLGLDIEDKRLFIPIGEVAKKEADNLLRAYGLIKTDSLVILHPWTSDPIKQWPVDNFLQLSRRLSGEYHCKVVIIGGKDEISQSEKFCEGRGDLINLTGKLTLRQLAAFFKKCRCTISNDSGPVHLASAVGTPVIAIFRNDTPGKSSRRWGPWGSGHIVIEKDDLDKITVDEVLDKIRILLGR